MLPESNDDLSQTLRQLKIAAPALDRDRLLYEAGRRSVNPSWIWPMATIGSLLLACFCTVLYWQQPANMSQQMPASVPIQPAEVHIVKQPSPEVLDPPSALSYLTLREESLSMKPPAVRTVSMDTKPAHILTAGSYIQPDWQR